MTTDMMVAAPWTVSRLGSGGEGLGAGESSKWGDPPGEARGGGRGGDGGLVTSSFFINFKISMLACIQDRVFCIHYPTH